MTIHKSGVGAVVEPENTEALLKGIHDLRANNLAECRRSTMKFLGRRWSSARELSSIEQWFVALPTSVPAPLANQEAGR